jgi:hypothetical protein
MEVPDVPDELDSPARTDDRRGGGARGVHGRGGRAGGIGVVVAAAVDERYGCELEHGIERELWDHRHGRPAAPLVVELTGRPDALARASWAKGPAAPDTSRHAHLV